MMRSQKIIVFSLVVIVGIYGCAKNPAPSTDSGKTSSQEAKAKRWEEDFRAAAAARDDLRQKLVASEEKQAQLVRQLERERATAANERDALKAELKLRLAERDSLQNHFDGLRKGLKDLLAQSESAPTSPNLPAAPTAPSSPSTAPSPALIGSQAAPSSPTGSTLSN
jgi:peptidoglycan hydrolase CwlO-like protein